ncbi:MAG: nicotinate-nucleotide adenylyltransferase, partial [Candidatus Omnitrophota bacterium]
LDKVIFIPTNRTPQKNIQELTASRHRDAMVRLAIKGNPAFEVSDVEIRRKGTSYTIDTVKTLRQKKPRATWILLVGSDCLRGLYAWRNVEELFRLCRFVIVRRPHCPYEGIPSGFEKLEIPQIDISSRDLRQRVREGRSIAYQVPKAVEQYILKHRLYR